MQRAARSYVTAAAAVAAGSMIAVTPGIMIGIQAGDVKLTSADDALASTDDFLSNLIGPAAPIFADPLIEHSGRRTQLQRRADLARVGSQHRAGDRRRKSGVEHRIGISGPDGHHPLCRDCCGDSLGGPGGASLRPALRRQQSAARHVGKRVQQHPRCRQLRSGCHQPEPAARRPQPDRVQRRTRYRYVAAAHPS